VTHLHFPVRQIDNGAYTCIQLLNAVSHSVGAGADSNGLCEVDSQSDSDDETDGDTAAAEPQEEHTQPPDAQSDDHVELCEVCLI